MSRATKIFVRSFLLEVLFNQRGKQRGGLAWALGGRGRSNDEEPFNTNPTLAGYLLGWHHRAGRAEIDRYRATLAAAFGAMGDRLVWGLLRPLAIVVSLIVAAAGPIPAALALMLVYNPPELAVRWRGVRCGLEGLQGISGDLARRGLPRLASRLARVAALAVGFLGGFWIVGLLASGRLVEAIAGLCGTVAGLLFLRLGRCGTWGTPLGAVLFALVWVVIGSIVP